MSLWGTAPVGRTGWSETSGSIRTHFLAYTFLFISLFLPTLLPAFALAKTSNGILNKSGASRHHCPVPDLREKAFSLLSLHFLPYDLRCSFLCICSLPMLRKLLLAISSVLRVFFMNIEFYQMPFPHLLFNLVICIFSLFLVSVTKKIVSLDLFREPAISFIDFLYSFLPHTLKRPLAN